MKRIFQKRFLALYTVVFLIGLTVIVATIFSAPKQAGPIEPFFAQARAQMASVRVPFVANEGQLDASVAFSARTFLANVSVTADGSLLYGLPHGVVRESFQGEFSAAPRGVLPSETRVSSFFGDDESRWQSDILTYDSVTLGTLWPNITVSLNAYGSNIEKIFNVLPGGDVGDIVVAFEPTAALRVTSDGGLVVDAGFEELQFTAPVAFQEVNGERREVEVAYVLHESGYGFSAGEYDRRYPLTIDPLLASTFLGGSGSEHARHAAVDSSGNVFVVGNTASANFPTSSGAYDTSGNGGTDVFVAKFNSGLTSLSAVTFLGGAGNDDAYHVKIDSSGNVFVTGETASSSTPFPTTSGAYDETQNGSDDVFIAKLSNTLASLSASTLLGSDGDDAAYSIVLDGSNNVYVTGVAASSSTPFPTTSGAYDETQNGDTEVFVSKLPSTLASLTASTFVGGAGRDKAYGIDLDSNGNVFVAGMTQSSGFPVTGGYDTTIGGSQDGFIVKLASDLASLTAGTFYGSTSNFEAMEGGIVLDGSDNVFVAMYTTGSGLATTGAYDETGNGGIDIVIAKFANDLGTLSAATYIGGSDDDYQTDTPVSTVAVDSGNNVYFAFWTISTNFPVTSGAYDETFNASESLDGYVVKFPNTLATLTVSTMLGGEGADDLAGLTIDSSDNIYIVGRTDGTDYPTSSGAYDTSHNGNQDVFVTKFSNLLLVGGGNTAPTITLATPSQTSGASTVTVTADVADTDSDATTVTVEYSSDNSTWASSTLGSVSATQGTVTTSTGQIASIDTDATSTVTLTITWLAGTDFDDTDDTSVYLRVRATDGTDYSSDDTSSAFALDTKDPTQPDAMTLDFTDNSVTMTPTVGSSDTNFTEYKIFYARGSGVTTSDAAYTSSSDSDLASATFNSSSTVTISGLLSRTDYYFKLYAFDAYGNSASSSEFSGATEGGGSSGGVSKKEEPEAPAPQTPDSSVIEIPSNFTIAEKIAFIQAEITRLKSMQISGGAFQFLRDLQLGMIHSDVRALQVYLNAHGFLIAASGVGSPGHETNYFGVLTKAALIRFQEAYRAEILTPSGLSRGTGFFGPATRAYANTH